MFAAIQEEAEPVHRHVLAQWGWFQAPRSLEHGRKHHSVQPVCVWGGAGVGEGRWRAEERQMRKVGKADPWGDQPREKGGTGFWHVGQILTLIPGLIGPKWASWSCISDWPIVCLGPYISPFTLSCATAVS